MFSVDWNSKPILIEKECQECCSHTVMRSLFLTELLKREQLCNNEQTETSLNFPVGNFYFFFTVWGHQKDMGIIFALVLFMVSLVSGDSELFTFLKFIRKLTYKPESNI